MVEAIILIVVLAVTVGILWLATAARHCNAS